MDIESQGSMSNFEYVEEFNYQNLVDRARWIQQNTSDLTKAEEEQLESMSPALRQCFGLRQKIEDSDFSCFFREPVNPHTEKLPDYWQKIRRPMDLLTIKRKFFIGIYHSHSQFHEDMRQMFTNFMIYNKTRSYMIQKAKGLSLQYEQGYQYILTRIQNKELSEEAEKRTNKQQSIASRLYPEELDKILTYDRKQKLGTLLEFLVNRNKVSLINTMTKMHPNLKITQNKSQKWVYLNNLTPHQIYDLLRLCQKMKAHDFDTAKLMTVRVDPLLEGYEEFQEKASVHESEVQSQFEIESESEG